MKKFFTEPTIEVKNFAAENIVTASGEEFGTADTNVTLENAAVTFDLQSDLGVVF